MKHAEQLLALRRLTDVQLSVKIGESQKNLITKRQAKLLGKLKNTAELRTLRREIAQMKTILDEKVAEGLIKSGVSNE
ncbi:MAG: 50S ribosomal protein L29 [Patescibacteria group bacterium]